MSVVFPCCVSREKRVLKDPDLDHLKTKDKDLNYTKRTWTFTLGKNNSIELFQNLRTLVFRRTDVSSNREVFRIEEGKRPRYVDLS